MRKQHCSFAELNSNGRCIASCHHNVQSDADCTGTTGKTLDSKNGREVRVTCGFIDGSDCALDSRGYKVPPAPVVVAEPEVTHQDPYKPEDVFKDAVTGAKFIWATTPLGLKYRQYFLPGGIPIT